MASTFGRKDIFTSIVLLCLRQQSLRIRRQHSMRTDVSIIPLADYFCRAGEWQRFGGKLPVRRLDSHVFHVAEIIGLSKRWLSPATIWKEV